MAQHFAFLLIVCFVRISVTVGVFKCGPHNRCTCQKTGNDVEIQCTGPSVQLFELCEYAAGHKITMVNFKSPNLTVITRDDLNDCGDLVALALVQSNLSDITDDALTNMKKLQTLDLRHNKLRNLYIKGELNRFEHLSNLTSLFINGNIQNYTENGTYPDLTSLVSLVTLSMDNVANAKFDTKFRRLKHLRDVSISGHDGFCNLGRVQNDTFEGLESVLVLNISACKLTGFEAGALLPLKHLEILDMSNNMQVGFAILPNVSFGLQYTRIKVFKFAKMFPTFGIGSMLMLKHVCFLWNTSLEELDLSSNRIQLIETNAAILVPFTLNVLRLDDNEFTFGPYLTQHHCASNVTEAYANREFTSHFPLLYNQEPSLINFDETLYFPKCPFMEDSYLRNISLLKPNCRFIQGHKVEWPDFLAVPPTLKRAEYSNCHIKYVIPFLHFSSNNSLEYADFSGNLLYSWLGPFGPFLHLKHLDISDNFCSFIGEQFFQYMPMLENLQIQKNYLGLSTIQEETFSKLCSLKKINLSSNRFDHLPKQIFSNLTNLENIDLSNNVLQAIDFEYTDLSNLFILNVSYNTIRWVPHKLLQYMLDVSIRREVHFQVDLSGNILSFNCFGLHFLKFLVDYHKHFANIDSYVFVDDNENRIYGYNLNKSFINLQKECVPYNYIIAACCTGLSLFFTVIIGGFVYKHRWKLRFLLHMAKRKYFGQQQMAFEESEDPNEIGKNFDAFISYAEGDVDFIRTGIIPQLEGNGLRLIIHQRDFLAGKPIADNIVDAIKSSKRTVAVISDKYLRQRWCLYEFQMARMESIYYHNNCLLIILLHPVPLDLMPLEMIEWIDKESYLEYTDDVDGNALFWDRLRTCLKETAN